MPNFYTTFGQGHNTPNAYMKITANNIDEAREMMFVWFAARWSMIYTEEKFLPQIKEFNLYERGRIAGTPEESDCQFNSLTGKEVAE